jgi:hypothetical protein
MRLVSLPTLVRTLAIFLASLQAARLGPVQAQTFGEVPPQAGPVSAPPMHATPLSGYTPALPVHPTLPDDQVADPALPADDTWLGAAMAGATTGARSPRTGRALVLVAHARPLDAQADPAAAGLGSMLDARDHTTPHYLSAHRPRAPCLSRV